MPFAHLRQSSIPSAFAPKRANVRKCREEIAFNKPFVVGKELSLLGDAIARGQIAGDGHYTKLCNRWLEDRLHCRKAALTHSCTAALELAAILCDIKPGDEVILPSYTFVSTANAFVLRGATAVFVDIRADNLNIDETLVEAAVTSKTRAIVPVHYAGVACAMDELTAIADRHDLFVVEDAAQALLSTYKGRFLGTLGDFGCISFHETKNVVSGEGGALLVNDEKYIDRAEIVREKGTNRAGFLRGEVDKYSWVDIGSSYLPSELISAFLYAQLEEAEAINARRRRICALYKAEISGLERAGHARLPRFDASSNGHMFYLLLDSLVTRRALTEFLKGKGIHPAFHYVPLHSAPAGRKFGRTGSDMKVTDKLSERLLRLPLHASMTDDDVRTVSAAVRQFFAGRHSPP